MKPERITPPQFRTVMTDCDACDDGLVYARDYGCTATTCTQCDGTCEIEARCPGCDEAKPLSDEGVCEDCTVPVMVEIARSEKGIWL